MITDRYKGPNDIPEVLPVFPLRGCLLLPRAALPLNIFEPRYLQLIDDALRGSRLVVIVQPARTAATEDEDGKVAESPPGVDVALRSTGCIGRVTAFQEVENGRMIVSLAGVVRCSLGAEVVSNRLYRTFRVATEAFVPDFIRGQGEDAVPRERLLTTLKQFLAQRNLKADWSSISRSPTETLVNSLSVMSPYGAEEKQALLETPTLKARAEMLIALAEMELAAPGGGSSGSTLQ